MSNVHGLFSDKKDDVSSDEEDDSNNRFVGGISAQGGGSGLAVEPNFGDGPPPPVGATRDGIFNLAEQAGPDDQEDESAAAAPRRRVITMYRDGFIVDEGPYRRLDDPANADFLRSLAQGRTPAELVPADGSGASSVTVGLLDKRSEDYDPPFASFSGAGATLGGSGRAGAASASGSTIVLNTLSSPQEYNDASRPMTSIAVRLPNGKRTIVKIPLDATVLQLAAAVAPHVTASDASVTSIRLVAGFPPKPLEDMIATIEAAGLKGAQVQAQKV